MSERYADEGMLETGPLKPVDRDPSSEVPATNEDPFQSYIDQRRLEVDHEKPVGLYQTLDYQPPQRSYLKHFLVFSLSHPLHPFWEKTGDYIYSLTGASKKQSEQTSYQSLESSNKNSTPVQCLTKWQSHF